jgi:pimeloyl-ACP methyl ester carboxylesterase
MFQLPLIPELLLTGGDAQGGVQLLLSSSRPGTFTDADIPHYVRAWKQPGAMTAMLNWYRAIVRYRPTMPADARIHVPTLVIWGVKDVALSRDLAQPSADMADDGRLVFFESASHWVQHEEAPGVNALLLGFFGQT